MTFFEMFVQACKDKQQGKPVLLVVDSTEYELTMTETGHLQIKGGLHLLLTSADEASDVDATP